MKKPCVALIAPSLALNPKSGGHWSFFEQYIYGLKDLNVDFLWIEFVEDNDFNSIYKNEIANGYLSKVARLECVERFLLVFYRKSCHYDDYSRISVFGGEVESMINRVSECDVTWDIGMSCPKEFISIFPNRALLDVDPGIIQTFCHNSGDNLDDYATHCSIGLNVGGYDCLVPTLGKKWHHFFPSVFTPNWKIRSNPPLRHKVSEAVHWYYGNSSDWEIVYLGKKAHYLAKRHSYKACKDLPILTKNILDFELVSEIYDVELDGWDDLSAMTSKGWIVRDPSCTCPDSSSYQKYIYSCSIGLSLPKPIYKTMKTGWISDKTVCHLASGNPVLMENTDIQLSLSNQNGLVLFDDIEELLDKLKLIMDRYEHHSQEARKIAESIFCTRKVLPRLIEVTTC